jgi:hypothetical protein
MLGSHRQILWTAATALCVATGAMIACTDDTATGPLTSAQQDAQLRSTLQTAVRPAVAMHLQMAQTLQARIGAP